jgi:hypothetical protein
VWEFWGERDKRERWNMEFDRLRGIEGKFWEYQRVVDSF